MELQSMDYCTVEQCHAIVNAAIAQLKLDLQLQPAPQQGSLSDTSPTQIAHTAGGAAEVAALSLTAVSADGSEPAGWSLRRSNDGEQGSASPAVRSGGGLGKTPRVKALLPKGRASIGVGEVDGGYAAPARLSSFSDTAGSESGSARERQDSRSDMAGTAAAAAASQRAVSADIGDSVFVRGYSPELLAIGVLKKWTNYGKGWESRIVVLDAGVIRYFSTKGKNKVNVAAIMGGRECYKIGDKVAKLQRKQGGMEQSEFQDKPLGEMHISVATIRISKSDPTKFRIFSGLKKSGAGNFGWRGALQLRAESSADRQRWINILNEMKSHYKTKELLQDDILQSTAGDDDLRRLEEQLQGLGASASVMDVVRTWAAAKEEAHEEALNKERDELMDLQDELRTVLEEKRYLEETIIRGMGTSTRRSRNQDQNMRGRPRNDTSHSDESDDENSSAGRHRPRRDSQSSRTSAQSVSSLSEDEDDELEDAAVQRASVRPATPRGARSVAQFGAGTFGAEPEPEPEPEVLPGQEQEDVSAEDDGPPRDSVDSMEFYDVNEEAEQAAADAAKEAEQQARLQAVARSLVAGPRLQIPVPEHERKLPPLWPLVKEAVGSDLSMVSLPAVFNEPLSLLQRVAEDMTYCNLIDSAVGCSDSRERLAHVAAFAVSCYASSQHRTLKPLDPLLGETFEYIRADLGFRYISEKVAGSPTVIAFHAESFDSAAFDADEGAEDAFGDRYRFWGDMQARVSFEGRSADLVPTGKLHLYLPQTNDHFTWQKVKSAVHNVIVGQLWVEHQGTLEVRNESTGESCRLRFGKQSEWVRGGAFDDQGNEVVGDVVDADGAPFATISGHWHDQLHMVVADGVLNCSSKTLWKAAPPHPHASMLCQLSRFAMDLNNDAQDLLQCVAPSDSRLRPDLRLLEKGEWEAAQREKLRLEEKHRAMQAKRDRSRNSYRPRWFRKVVRTSRISISSIFGQKPVSLGKSAGD